MTTPQEIWIGLAELVPLEGSVTLGQARGAFVNVVGSAESERDFYSKVEKAIASMNLKLLSLGDAEPFSQRSAKWEVDDLILQMVDTARENREDIVFGTFHMWHKADA